MIISAARYRRIYWIARLLRLLTVTSIAFVAVITVFPFMSQITEWTILPGVITKIEPLAATAADLKIARWLCVLPHAILIYGLYRLAKMMRAYERGELFTPPVPTHLLAFSTAIVVVELLQITLPLQIAIAHRVSSGMHSEARLVITSEQLWLLLLAALFMILASVMREAASIAADNASIV